MSKSSTVYLRPPVQARPKARSKVPPKPHEDLRSFLYKYRSQWVPFFLAFWAGSLATLIGPFWWGTPALMAVYLVIGIAVYQDQFEPPNWFPWLRLDRPVEHRYAAGCAAVALGWSGIATWGAVKPDWHALLALVLLTIITAVPWWHHRRIRGSILVRFDGIRGPERNRKLLEARGLVRGWTSFTSAGHVSGAKLRAITFNPWSTMVAIQLRQGATVGEFTARRLDKLESAADAYLSGVQSGSARVDRVERHTRLAVLRFMTSDPHENPIRPPETGQTDLEKIILGLFETGEQVLLSLVSTLIAGLTGSGKSVLQNVIIRALASIPTVAIVGIDMKPGAPEFGPWRKVMHAIGTDKASTDEILDRIFAGLSYRGHVMSANGWRNWVPTRDNPFIVLIVDEVHLLDTKQRKKLDDIVSIIRAYGGMAIVATQYPIKASVSSAIKANCKQRIGFQVADGAGDRVVFGDQATRTGWRPSVMVPADREGSFLIKSPKYKRPVLARSFMVDDVDVPDVVEQWAPFRTTIDAGTWNQLDAPERLAELDAGDDPEIVDAVIVPDDDPLERVLAALAVVNKTSELITLTGYPRASLNRYLNQLRDQGLADNPKRGEWILTGSSQ
jgi:hypothetical protein